MWRYKGGDTCYLGGTIVSNPNGCLAGHNCVIRQIAFISICSFTYRPQWMAMMLHLVIIQFNLTLAISDHLPSFFIIPKDNQNHTLKKQNLYTRKTKNFDKVNFVCDYLDINWDTILEANKNNVNISL